MRIYHSLKKAKNSIEKLPRTGHPKTFDERGGKVVCWTVKRLRFELLRNISRVVQRAYPCRSPSKSLVKGILYKYGIKSFKRKGKPFVSLKKSSKFRCAWSRSKSH